MNINTDCYQALSGEKQDLIKRSYTSYKSGEISLGDFFDICKGGLEVNEFKNLFTEEDLIEDENPQIPKSQNDYSYDYRIRETKSSNLMQENEEIEEPKISEQMQAYYTPTETDRVNNNTLLNRKTVNNINERESSNHIKPKDDNIDDVIHYTGIDLKEEADIIAKDIDYVKTQPTFDMGGVNMNEYDDLLNTTLLTKKINVFCYEKDVKITEDALNIVFRSVYHKLLDLLDNLNEASAIRTEAGVLTKYVKPINERSKQLWLLNEIEKDKHSNLMLQKEEDRQKRKGAVEKEDLAVKKRQSNSVAMQAMGIKQKSWMKYNVFKEDEINKLVPVYASFDTAAMEKAQDNRAITIDDLIYVLERDNRYSKSAFLMKLKYNK